MKCYSLVIEERLVKEIDGLIKKHGLYSSRSDFIRDAIRQRLIEIKQLMGEKVEEEEEEKKKEVGRTVLEWSHRDAHKDVGLIRTGWSNPNLVQGTYQILSKDMSVGWHPDFRTLIKVDESGGNK